jgi:hypothetical protein
MAFLTIQPIPQVPEQASLQSNGAAIGMIAAVQGAAAVTTAQAASPATRQRFDDRNNNKRGRQDANSASVEAKTNQARGQIKDFTV